MPMLRPLVPEPRRSVRSRPVNFPLANRSLPCAVTLSSAAVVVRMTCADRRLAAPACTFEASAAPLIGAADDEPTAAVAWPTALADAVPDKPPVELPDPEELQAASRHVPAAATAISSATLTPRSSSPLPETLTADRGSGVQQHAHHGLAAHVNLNNRPLVGRERDIGRTWRQGPSAYSQRQTSEFGKCH